MPRKTATERILNHVLFYGAATIEELADKFDVSRPTIHNLLSSPQHPIERPPSFVIAAFTQYRFLTDSQLRSEEVQKLFQLIGTQIHAYQMTHDEKFKNHAIIFARKLVAVAFDMLLMTMLLRKSTELPTAPNGNEVTDLAERQITALNRAYRTNTTIH